MVEDTRYQRRLLQDLRTRRLKPSTECLLWAYAIGKPAEDEDDDLLTLEQQYRRLVPQQLYTRALAIARMPKEPDEDQPRWGKPKRKPKGPVGSKGCSICSGNQTRPSGRYPDGSYPDAALAREVCPRSGGRRNKFCGAASW